MVFDPKQLLRDAHRAQANRPTSEVGRETTGVSRAVRDALSQIKELREAGVTWAAIAQAMSEQGLNQGNGRPLTASRLTAIVTQIEAQDRRRTIAKWKRLERNDVAPNPSRPLLPLDPAAGRTRRVINAPGRPRLALAPDLVGAEQRDIPRPSGEDTGRRAALEKAKRLLKKD